MSSSRERDVARGKNDKLTPSYSVRSTARAMQSNHLSKNRSRKYAWFLRSILCYCIKDHNFYCESCPKSSISKVGCKLRTVQYSSSSVRNHNELAHLSEDTSAETLRPCAVDYKASRPSAAARTPSRRTYPTSASQRHEHTQHPLTPFQVSPMREALEAFVAMSSLNLTEHQTTGASTPAVSSHRLRPSDIPRGMRALRFPLSSP